MEFYYARIARSVLSGAAEKIVTAQDLLAQAEAPEYVHRSSARILTAIRNFQDELLHLELKENDER